MAKCNGCYFSCEQKKINPHGSVHLSRDLMFSKAISWYEASNLTLPRGVLIDMCELSTLLFMGKCKFKLDMFKKMQN